MKITTHKEVEKLTRISSGGEGMFLSVEEESLSCTGPTVLTVRFSREFLHELEVGPEVVVITLSPEVK